MRLCSDSIVGFQRNILLEMSLGASTRISGCSIVSFYLSFVDFVPYFDVETVEAVIPQKGV